MKSDRLLAITMMLINNKKMSAKELADYFEVSVRTIQRDMEHLAMAGVPIFADVGKNGGYRIAPGYKLSNNFLNSGEATMLVALLKNIEHLVPYDEAKSMTNKLRTILPDEGKDEKLIFSMSPQSRDSMNHEHMKIITKARESLKKVSIVYIDANFTETTRCIAPYRLVMMGSVWYVYAYCDEREDFRLFKLNRILECRLENESFELLPLPTKLPWEELNDGTKTSTLLILEIDLCLKGKLPDYFDYRSCKVLEDKIIVSLNFPVDEWLYSLLLSLVPYIRVVEPKWVQEEMIHRMEKGIEKMKIIKL